MSCKGVILILLKPHYMIYSVIDWLKPAISRQAHCLLPQAHFQHSMEQFPENWQIKKETKWRANQHTSSHWKNLIYWYIIIKNKIQGYSRKRGRKHTLGHIYLIHHEPEEYHLGWGHCEEISLRHSMLLRKLYERRSFDQKLLDFSYKQIHWD